MKRILLSLGTLVAVGSIVAGGTIAFFQDTETSSGNIFVAGAIDLKVDHTYAEYNGKECNDCEEGSSNLIVNGGFETPIVTDNGGQWQVFPDGTLTSWEVTGGSAGLEIQRNGVAGAPHGGVQLAELDSHTPGDSSSGIEQVISTVPGQQYRLRFWHSPRPNNGPNTDNAVELDVLVTSTSGTMITDTIGLPSFSGSGTVWTEHVYDFVALDSETTIRFTDAGSQQDTLGGYLDDVSVRTLDCEDTFPFGGTCTLWSATDLDSERFWNFTDVKPGDWGKNVISLHVFDNDAYTCLFPGNINDDENGIVDPETDAGDAPNVGLPSQFGELSSELEFFFWHDENGNNQYDIPESVLVDAGTRLNQIPTEIVDLALVGGAPIELVGIEWCAGTQTGPTQGNNNTPLDCDGAGMGNIAQTDKVDADFIAYAVQQRNNDSFTCQAAFSELFPPQGPQPTP